MNRHGYSKDDAEAAVGMKKPAHEREQEPAMAWRNPSLLYGSLDPPARALVTSTTSPAIQKTDFVLLSVVHFLHGK